MKIWASANQKGGVGKTTTVVSLAGLLAKQGKRVLLVDLDPHGSMTSYFNYDPDTQDPSLYHLFQTPAVAIENIIMPVGIDGVHLIPSSTALATLDRQLGTQKGKGLVLYKALTAQHENYDYCLIDCPPLLGILMVNALAAISHLLVPVQTEFLAIKGLDRMMHTLSMILKARTQPLDVTIVPTMFDRRTRAAIESLRHLREKYEDKMWDSVIPVDTKFREASRSGVPICEIANRSRGNQAYSELLSFLSAEKNPQHTAEVISL